MLLGRMALPDVDTAAVLAALSAAPPPDYRDELDRILALPVKNDMDVEDAWVGWTVELRKHDDAPPLNVAQGAMLDAWHQNNGTNRGAFGSLGVGAGKTLIILLALAVMSGIDPDDAVVLVPPGLDQVLYKQYHLWQEHYHVKLPRVVTYSQLSQPGNSSLLYKLAPKVLLLDEAHNLRLKTSARYRRTMGYIKDNPDTRALVMSGTITDGKLSDYMHLLWLALRDQSPGPIPPKAVNIWASVIDPQGEPIQAERRALEPLRTWSGQDDWECAFFERMAATKGVVCTRNASVDAAIHVRFLRTSVPESMQEAITELKSDWMLPDGRDICEASEAAAHSRSMSVGFWYDLEPPPSEAWAIARRNWGRELRTLLNYRSRRDFDSPKVVEDALRRTTYAGYNGPKRALLEWDKHRHLARGEHRTVWLDKQYILDVVRTWAQEHDGKGLIWYATDAVGTLLKEAGYDVRGAGDVAPDPHEHLVALNIGRFSEGFNLQYQSANLVLEPPPSGKTFDQLLGRTHRQGQTADTVTLDVLAATYPQRQAIQRALAKAASMERKTGQRHRLRLASKVWVDYDIEEQEGQT